MPELPEVQTTVNGLARVLPGLVIADVWTDYGSAFHKGKDSIKDPAYFKHFKKEVIGARIIRVDRKAKNILIHIEKKADPKNAPRQSSSKRSVILVHMKMTGHLLYGNYDRKDPFNRFIHLIFALSNGKTLELSDMRKFAKVTLIAEADLERTVHLERIGPDPLEKRFTVNDFVERFRLRPNGKIKQALMDQSIIAGVGNIYSDEALWRAGLHPEERVQNIPPARMKRLFADLRSVLKKGIDFGGDSMSDYRNIDGTRGHFQEKHRAYRKTGQTCSKPGCGGTIRRMIVGGRSAHFCDRHQKLLQQPEQEYPRRH